MRRERFQNKVATGSFTLPAAAVLATLLWCGEGVYTLDYLWGWLVCGLTVYLWVETNNAYSLIRVRSLLTPSVYLFMTGCVSSLHPLQRGSSHLRRPIGLAILMSCFCTAQKMPS